MFYTVYKITNDINGKTYIGVHKTEDINDNYKGSGKILKKAQLKYGIENFSKEILYVFDNEKDMFSMECILVDDSFVSRKDTYNLKVGGVGGWDSAGFVSVRDYDGVTFRTTVDDPKYINGELKHVAFGLTHTCKNRVGVPRTEETKEKLRKHATGRTQTEESKSKIGLANSLKQKGSGNSQYGTCWIYNIELQKCKKINKEDLQSWTEDGWIKGRKMTL